ncbi:Ubiquitin-like protein 7 [Trichoplax sp. H2]|nr:Ubiquitin-like protein 7 [Trichoplax sp. H2]|eukprot:RDD46355.1 Ubiquitin-like protein 7 [Trichoplax sp. H2]
MTAELFVSSLQLHEDLHLKINLKDKVENLKIKISRHWDISIDYQNLVYKGQLLTDGNSLESYNIREKSTVYLLPKKQIVTTEETTVNVNELISKLRRAMLNPKVLEKISTAFDKPEVIQQVHSAIPGLRENTIAFNILVDKDLMRMLMDPSNLESVIKAHPVLGQAVLYVMKATGINVREIPLRDGASLRRQVHSNGGNSDDSNDDTYELSNPEQFPIGDVYDTFRPYGSGATIGATQTSESAAGTSQTQLVTRQHLEAALASAFTSSSTQNDSAESLQSQRHETRDSPTTSSVDQEPNRITSDLLSQALDNALGSDRRNNTILQERSQERQKQIQILREMGIQDDALSLRALELTNGDINRAVNLILNGDI